MTGIGAFLALFRPPFLGEKCKIPQLDNPGDRVGRYHELVVKNGSLIHRFSLYWTRSVRVRLPWLPGAHFAGVCVPRDSAVRAPGDPRESTKACSKGGRSPSTAPCQIPRYLRTRGPDAGFATSGSTCRR